MKLPAETEPNGRADALWAGEVQAKGLQESKKLGCTIRLDPFNGNLPRWFLVYRSLTPAYLGKTSIVVSKLSQNLWTASPSSHIFGLPAFPDHFSSIDTSRTSVALPNTPPLGPSMTAEMPDFKAELKQSRWRCV